MAIGSGRARWKLVGPDGVTRKVEVDANSKACATNPFEEELEQPRMKVSRSSSPLAEPTAPSRAELEATISSLHEALAAEPVERVS